MRKLKYYYSEVDPRKIEDKVHSRTTLLLEVAKKVPVKKLDQGTSEGSK